ncbi:MAG: 2TM domain-containing protein [Hyphomicrobiaceae bacterium]
MQTQSASAPPTASEEARLARARRRVEALKGFYVHLFVFALVLGGLTIINAAVGGPWWVLWVLLGWGIGVLAHGLVVLGYTSRTIADWEARKLRQYLNER